LRKKFPLAGRTHASAACDFYDDAGKPFHGLSPFDRTSTLRVSTRAQDARERRPMEALRELVREGRIAWAAHARAWIARPDDITNALTREGFTEFKADAARTRRDRVPAGGIWQGLDARTGAVASAIWIREYDNDRAVVFVDVDGAPVNETEGR
jgi:hypothetical protein